MKYFILLFCLLFSACSFQSQEELSSIQNTTEQEDIYITTFGDVESGYVEVSSEENVPKGSIIKLHGSLINSLGEEVIEEEIPFGYFDSSFESIFTILSNTQGQYFAKTRLERTLKDGNYYIDIQLGTDVSRIVFLQDVTHAVDITKDPSINKYYYTKLSKKDGDYAVGLDISLIETS